MLNEIPFHMSPRSIIIADDCAGVSARGSRVCVDLQWRLNWNKISVARLLVRHACRAVFLERHVCIGCVTDSIESKSLPMPILRLSTLYHIWWQTSFCSTYACHLENELVKRCRSDIIWSIGGSYSFVCVMAMACGICSSQSLKQSILSLRKYI